jgi:hypothetical protein
MWQDLFLFGLVTPAIWVLLSLWFIKAWFIFSLFNSSQLQDAQPWLINFGSSDILAETREFGQKTYPYILMGEVLWPRSNVPNGCFSFIAALPHVWLCDVSGWCTVDGSAWSRPSRSIKQVSSSTVHLHMGPLHSWHQGFRLWSMVSRLNDIGMDGRWGVCPCGKAGGWMAFGQKSASSFWEAVEGAGT